MIARGLQSGKFAEDLYMLLMASPLRARLEALGRKYGLDHAALSLEIMRYAGELSEWADDEPQRQLNLNRETPRGNRPAA